MKPTLRLLICLCAISLCPAVSPAGGYLENADANTIGFYFEECGWCNELYAAPFSTQTGHVVLARPTASEIDGYVFGLDYFGPVVQTTIDLNGAAPVNLAIELGAYHVMLSEPLPTTEATVLATVGLFITGSTPGEIYGRGLPGSGDCQLGYFGPGGFVDCYWPICGITMPGDPCPGMICESAYPLAVVNGPAPVATDRASWSAVKSIYGGF